MTDEVPLKTCLVCKRELRRTNYWANARSKDGVHHSCKDCSRKKNRDRYRTSPEQWAEAKRNEKLLGRNPEKRRQYHLKANHNMAPIEYDRMFAMQDGVCKICGERNQSFRPSSFGRYLFVDHDHTTGKIRGLLCNKCNSGLGMFRDNEELLTRAIAYLADSKTEKPMRTETEIRADYERVCVQLGNLEFDHNLKHNFLLKKLHELNQEMTALLKDTNADTARETD